MAPRVTQQNILEETARKITGIIQQVLDQLPPAEKARKLKAYLAKNSAKTSSSSSVAHGESRSKGSASAHAPVFRVAARSR
jgi:hypothetical protein